MKFLWSLTSQVSVNALSCSSHTDWGTVSSCVNQSIGKQILGAINQCCGYALYYVKLPGGQWASQFSVAGLVVNECCLHEWHTLLSQKKMKHETTSSRSSQWHSPLSKKMRHEPIQQPHQVCTSSLNVWHDYTEITHAYSVKGWLHTVWPKTIRTKPKYDVFSKSKASHEKLHVKFQVSIDCCSFMSSFSHLHLLFSRLQCNRQKSPTDYCNPSHTQRVN